MSLTFAFRARTPTGDPVAGTMRALDRRAALATLRERLLIPTSIRSAPSYSLVRAFARPKPHERLAFFRAYALLEGAGVDFGTSIAALAGQTTSVRMRDALESIRFDVERNGEKLWAAMARRPDEFSDLEIAMVAAGEEAGTRAEVFDRLATFLERDAKIRKELTSALFYPAIVLVSAALVSLYLVAFVLPQFGTLFASFDVPESPLLRALLGLTAIVTHPLFVAATVAIALATSIATTQLLRTTEGALAFDGLRLRVPLFGEAIRKTVVARTCRVVATLLQSGVQHVRALEVAVPVAESPIYERAIAAARARLVDGRAASLEEAFAESGVFPPLVLGFVRIGTAAGNVPAMLCKIAEYYESDVERLLTTIPALVQTLVTLGLGVVVGAIVYVVYVPLSTLGSSIH